MTINVYWTRVNLRGEDYKKAGFQESNMISPLRIHEPVPLLKHIDHQEFLGPWASKCPALVDDLKNVFVIKSPFDIKLSLGVMNSAKIENQTPEFGKAFFGEPQGRIGMHQTNLPYLFFAEKSLMLSHLPAFYDFNSFTENTFQIVGGFDIGRWFRAAGKPTFIFKPGKTVIDIKEGDALLYIKFNTTEKIKLIEFDNAELDAMGNLSPTLACVNLKEHATEKMSLKKCYEYFDRFKMRQRILKIIKRNKI